MTLLVLGLGTSVAYSQADYQTTATGLKYKFLKKGDAKNPQPVISDMVTISAFYHGTDKDTIFFDSRKSPTPYIFPVLESVYKGDL